MLLLALSLVSLLAAFNTRKIILVSCIDLYTKAMTLLTIQKDT